MTTGMAHLRLTGDEEAPVRLVGPPRRLRGRLAVTNAGERRGVLREAALIGSQDLLGEGRRLRYRLGATVVRPEEHTEVPIVMSLDPATPPGEYRIEVEVGDDVRPVLVRVVEETSLSLRPTRLVVENRPGEVQTKEILVTNTGNVELTIGDIGDAVLDDELFECRTLRRALRELTDEDPEADRESVSLERILTELAHASRHVLDRANRLHVRNAAGTTVVPPGEEATIQLEIEVPETLSQHTRYRGAVPVYTHDLEFVVVPFRPQAVEAAPDEDVEEGGSEDADQHPESED